GLCRRRIRNRASPGAILAESPTGGRQSADRAKAGQARAADAAAGAAHRCQAEAAADAGDAEASGRGDRQPEPPCDMDHRGSGPGLSRALGHIGDEDRHGDRADSAKY
ncbi:hypothetical protein KXV85_004965, partial [Aspergillus fumigatus]